MISVEEFRSVTLMQASDEDVEPNEMAVSTEAEILRIRAFIVVAKCQPLD